MLGILIGKDTETLSKLLHARVFCYLRVVPILPIGAELGCRWSAIPTAVVALWKRCDCLVMPVNTSWRSRSNHPSFDAIARLQDYKCNDRTVDTLLPTCMLSTKFIGYTGVLCIVLGIALNLIADNSSAITSFFARFSPRAFSTATSAAMSSQQRGSVYFLSHGVSSPLDEQHTDPNRAHPPCSRPSRSRTRPGRSTASSSRMRTRAGSSSSRRTGRMTSRLRM